MQTISPHYLGCGLGLRNIYIQEILEQNLAIDWLEITTENYLNNHSQIFTKIREKYPVVMHGVSMSLGSTDPLNWDYLQQVKTLAHKIQPDWISDHCCWTGVQGINLHDLLPLPYTEEALQHVADRICQVQDFLQRPLVIENVSSYVSYQHSIMQEWEFLTALTAETGCYLLLDLNNVYVSSTNHHFDPITFIEHIPIDRVQQFHLAGHTHEESYIIDTHDNDIIEPVWQLFDKALQRFGKVATMIERDDNFPPLATLLQELDCARRKIAQLAI